MSAHLSISGFTATLILSFLSGFFKIIGFFIDITVVESGTASPLHVKRKMDLSCEILFSSSAVRASYCLRLSLVHRLINYSLLE